MKKIVLSVALSVFACGSLYAEDMPAEMGVAPTASEVSAEAQAAMPAVETPAPAAPVVAAPAAAEPAAPAETLEPATDNLEFISGEVTALDEAAGTVTVKMYGETSENEADKMLTVTVDANTDITDGEQDRDLKSLTPSTEVDVEYDPASKKATYIFVY